MGCGGSTPTREDRAGYDNQNGGYTDPYPDPYYPEENNKVQKGLTDYIPDGAVEYVDDILSERGYEDERAPIPQPRPQPPKIVEKDKFTSDSVDYKPTTVGTYEAYRDFRHSGEPFDDEDRPSVAPGELWVDEGFTLYDAIKGRDNEGLEWKRPFEFCESPVLYSDGTTRFDIGQGSAGTCWFLSMVASVSEKTELLKRVIPDDSYRFNTDQYDGIFYAKFWRFGQWDNVFIDDFLPVIYGDQLWGAKSATDKNEMWVALLEKSFARLFGAYNEVYGGQPGDAYLALTGGVVERIDFDENMIRPEKLFQRVKNSLQSSSLVSCVVPEEYDEVMGLIGGHAYSLNGTAMVQTGNGENVRLVRVRNPWGHTEWNGAWSDGSAEWQQLPSGTVENPIKDDGEFWMALEDFLQYFSQLTICSITPDIDCDGSGDCLSHVMYIYGEWKGETAAGFPNRVNNPRYIFTVSDDGMTCDGMVPIVIQVIQRTIRRKADRFSIRCDLYQVSGEKMASVPSCVLEMQGGEDETNVYSPEIQTTHRHHVKPGKYAVIPSCIEPGQEKEFLVRIFSVSPLQDVREMSRSAVIMSCEQEKVLQYNGQELKLDRCMTIFGEWRQGINAGGQVSNRETFSTNPQFYFTVPNSGELEPVVFHVMQEQDDNKSPVGLRLFPYNGSVSLPVDVDYMYHVYESCPQHIDGQQGKFVVTWDLDVKYVLPAGEYIALIHMDKPTDEAKYALLIKSKHDLNITAYQAG
ncbi:hypothetical protein SNE40_023508 [Patella caerulea]|uniref:Calpain catalytic domain-containing protein n=1 Tax=Patella caerulea TaxID=87958 RepID=A0AAN8GI33_PATCE